jgi:hypothetical protein
MTLPIKPRSLRSQKSLASSAVQKRIFPTFSMAKFPVCARFHTFQSGAER